MSWYRWRWWRFAYAPCPVFSWWQRVHVYEGLDVYGDATDSANVWMHVAFGLYWRGKP